MSRTIDIQKNWPKLIKDGSILFGNIKQDQKIDGLTEDQTRALAMVVSARESTNNQHVISRHGYLGLFQFGAEALANVGLIKKKNVENLLKKHPKGKGLYSKKNGSPSPHEKFLMDDDIGYYLEG